MKLWLLEARSDLPKDDNPWEPWYDKAFAFVVRAETEEEARELATQSAGDETTYSGYFQAGNANAWRDEKYSTCVELTTQGEAEVVIKDYARA